MTSAVHLYAPTIYGALNGIFCVYKPAGSSIKQLVHAIRTNLTRELNRLPCRPPRQRVLIAEKLSDTDNDLPSVTTAVDFADHPLVAGPRYVEEDFNIAPLSSLSMFASGVQVMGIGRGLSNLYPLARARYLRVYHVKGQFGLATQDFTPNGRLIEKTTYHHISSARLDRVIAAIQAGHQKYMFTASGVDLQSQEAYELACQGLLRPAAHSDASTLGPLLYSVKCIHFKPPDFTLEIHSINETSTYLMKLIHEIGLELRSSAVCTGLRRIRYGHFTVAHALLTKHCDARSISENIDFCRPLVRTARQAERADVIQKQDVGLSAADAEKMTASTGGRNFVDDIDCFDNIDKLSDHKDDKLS